MRNFIVILLAFVFGFFALNATAAKVSPEYLIGLWSLEGKEQCDSDSLDYVEFFADGTFKTGNLAKVESVGYWRLYKEDDDLDLHMLTSLGFFGTDYAEFKGSFSYLDLKALPLNVRKDEFDGVASFGDDLEKFTATRCK